MKHNVYGKHLGRNKNQRQALFRGLVRSLFLQESITTTRVSGFTNSVKLGIRHGDGAMMVKMSLMEGDKEVQSQEIKKQIKSSKIRKERLAPKR